jgi:hypothetical protein
MGSRASLALPWNAIAKSERHPDFAVVTLSSPNRCRADRR